MTLKNRILFLFFLTAPFVSNSQNWPILQTDDANYWNRISATSGEIHPTNGDHFHNAIDIDVDVLNCPARAIDDGSVYQSGSISIGVEHLYPAGTTTYYRRSRYLHVVSNPSLATGSSVCKGDEVATVQLSSSSTTRSDHLHLEMWQFENGAWYKLNPLGNETDWELGSPPDNANPQINDIYLEPVTQPNKVASGFSIFKNSGSIVDNTTNVKIHFANRPGSTGTVFNSNNDALIVYGNIIPTVSVRDVSINSPSSSGDGLTIHKINYKINRNLKYQIYFDKVSEAEQNSVTEIFHTELNSGDNRLFGNNDFIEMYTTNGIYLTPDKLINNAISNGVWFTKALNNTQHVFATTPTTVANYNGNALYSDGLNTLNFQTEDASGLTNSVDLKVVVDNFRPYVKKVIVTKNSVNGPLSYVGEWRWNPGINQLERSANTMNSVGPGETTYIKIIMSEPCTNVRVNIPSVDGSNFYDVSSIVSATEFIKLINPIAISNTQQINIQAEDLAGNPLQTNPDQIPTREANGTWSSGVSPGVDSWHHFNTGTSSCAGNPGGRVAANGRTSSGCLYADFSPSKLSPAVGEAVTYTPVVAGNGVITYNWDFGPGAIPAASTSSGPQTVVYSTSGAKTVSLKICDNTTACITDTQTSVINVGAPPTQLTVDFSADRFGGNTGDNIRLTSTVNGAVGAVSYAWDFGEGILTGQFSDVNPLISYSTPGNKSIQLRVTDANGSVTTVKNNYLIITSTSFNVNVAILTGCGPTGANGAASFSAAVSGGNGPPYDSYRWDFGDGNTSNALGIVVHTYKKSGKYTVRLTVCDETGCGTAESIDCVTVPSIVDANTLSADFLIEDILLGPTYSPIQVGLNTPVTFSDATTGGGNPSTFTYSWDFESHYNNSTSTESAFPGAAATKGANEVYYTVAGTKEVTLVVANQSVTRLKTKVDAINVVKGLGSGRCFATLGEATVSSTCWSPTSLPQFAIPVVKSNCPVAKTEVIYWPTTGQGIVLPNNKLDFTAMGLAVPEFPLTADFSFTVYQNDGISYNRIGYKRQRFTIYGPVSVDGGADQQACLGTSVVLGTTSLDNLSYKWTAANASDLNFLSSTNLANPVFTGTQNGTYTFSVKSIDNQTGCLSVSDNVIVTVNKPAVASASLALSPGQVTALTTNTSGGFGANTYSWSPATNLSSTTISNPTFTSAVTSDFDYMVTVTDQLGCQSSGQVHVNVSSAPGTLVAKAESFSRISLNWIDRSTNETGFVIQRSVTGETPSDYATVGANVTSFQDANVLKGTTYTYRVGIVVGGITSGFSNTCTINTDATPLFSKITIPGFIVAYGDYDNDKQLEFGAQNVISGLILNIFKYSPLNEFTLWRSLTSHTRTSISADFDNDGDLDIYVNQGNSLNRGPDIGNPQLITNTLSGFNIENKPTGTNRMDWVDCDADNDVDIIMNPDAGLHDVKPLSVYLNSGTNQYTVIPYLTMTSYWNINSAGPLSQGDYDNDGDPDIVSSLHTGNGSEENFYLCLFKKEYLGYSNDYAHFFWAPGINLNLDQNAVDIETEFGDFDNDGWKDIICAGVGGTTNKITIFKNNRDGSFSKIIFDKRVWFYSVAKWGDYDGDGDLDFLVSGRVAYLDEGPDMFQVYNNNNGVFTLVQNGTELIDDWVDFDNDGDLDLIGVGGYMYINNLGTNLYKANTPPTAPTNLCSYINGDKVTFSWSRASDGETPTPGLSYNLYVKRNGQFILSPLSDLITGYRKVVARGNVDLNTSWTLTIPGGGYIEWGVQAIDNQYIGSTFATNSAGKAFQDIALCGNYLSNEMFFAKTIEAPKACSSNTVTVLTGASVTLRANNLIRLLPGSSAQRGSAFSAKIVGENQVPCTPSSGSRVSTEDAIPESKNETPDSSVKIYPNPAQGEINIEAAFSGSRDVTVEVINITGYVLVSKEYNEVDLITDRLDISSFAEGVYLIRVLDGKAVKTFRIVKQQ